MPKKAVTLFFLLAFLGAALFVFFTFPRTRNQIPTSNMQRPFPSAPPPTPAPNNGPTPPNGPGKPGGAPVTENVPQPLTPRLPAGPSLHVMAWATGAEAKRLSARADAFTAASGRQVELTLSADEASYRRELAQAVASETPPDLCLVSSRDFSGLDPARDLIGVPASPTAPPRAIVALTADREVRAVPDEFSVDVLFYNPLLFDQAGIAYPGPHWNWDMLEADARALKSLQSPNAKQAVYPLEVVPDFDLWDILCAEAGHPALDLDHWHVTDPDTKETQLRALDTIHDLFQTYAIMSPPAKPSDPLGKLFAENRVALLIAPSETGASFPAGVRFAVTVLPRDQNEATVARVNGWAVPSRSGQSAAAQALAQFLSMEPVHQGWNAMRAPPADDGDSPAAACFQSLAQALVPRLDPKTARMTQFIDKQIVALTRNPQQSAEATFSAVEAQFQRTTQPAHTGPTPAPKATPAVEVRGFE